jgi:hypothetical protein
MYVATKTRKKSNGWDSIDPFDCILRTKNRRDLGLAAARRELQSFFSWTDGFS